MLIMYLLLGLAGMGLPFQTGINALLKRRVGSPYTAALISFVVALIFLLLLLTATGQEWSLPAAALEGAPLWIWAGGLCGAIFLTGNILLHARLGSVQTIVLPVMGQILMGLIIDTYGYFHAAQTPLSLLRIVGAILVVGGVLTVSLAKENGGTSVIPTTAKATANTSANAPIKTSEINSSASMTLWLWRLFGVFAGMMSATQVAVNGYLGHLLTSPVKASVISFVVGVIVLALICIGLAITSKKSSTTANSNSNTTAKANNGQLPWWIWFGGILGAFFVLGNVYLAALLGTGMTVVVLLITGTTGGLIVDHFGLFRSPVKPINGMKVLGIIAMIAGAALIKLL
jgi:transporter family-2 protein